MGFNSPEEFLAHVSERSKQAVEYGRKASIRHCMDQADLDEGDAGRFYSMVCEFMAAQPSKVVMNMRPDEMLSFLATGRHKSGLDGLDEPKFNADAQKMMQVERAIGCIGLRPAYANVASMDEGLRAYGRCSVVLAGLENRTILISGDSYRLRNPARPDYVNDPFNVIYKYQDMANCRATAAIMSLGKPDLLGGPDMAMKAIASGDKGFCEALIFSAIAPGAVARIVADDDGNAMKIRRLLDQLNRMAPVSVVAGGAPESDDPQDSISTVGRVGSPMMFMAGDRVAMKPSASNPTVLGTILDVTDGSMSIEWDDSSRAVYDIMEALARIMPAPKHEVTREGEVVYSLPGMDVDTVHVLNSLGIDPVSVYSLSSFAMPASDKDDGWRDRLVTALDSIGIRAHAMHGYALDEADTKVAFKKATWVEANLPDGARLVVDASGSRLIVKAGDVDEYVPASPESEVVME